MRSFLAALALAGTLSIAHAHDSWISRGAFRNFLGEWCCAEDNCGILERGSVKITFNGYRIDGFMTIGEGAGSIRIDVHELVPFGEVQPSPDGEYWRCKAPSGKRRCFFAPPQTD